MNAQAFTPGPWVVVTGKNISVVPCPGKAVAICNYDNGPIEKANAALVAEAGTVAHETGLTPRQLAEQRELLLATLVIAGRWAAQVSELAAVPKGVRKAASGVAAGAGAAIAKVEGRS